MTEALTVILSNWHKYKGILMHETCANFLFIQSAGVIFVFLEEEYRRRNTFRSKLFPQVNYNVHWALKTSTRTNPNRVMALIQQSSQAGA